MEAVFGLMLMLLGLCQGVVRECDVTTNGTCYGALGGSVLLRMGAKPVRLRIHIKKTKIFEWKNSTIFLNDLKNRSVFNYETGTFKIDNLTSSDAENYTFEIFDSDGKIQWRPSIQLFLQDPVKSAQLDRKCLSQGELRVSCLHVGGDSPHFQWTLDGRTLTNDQLIFGNPQTKNITLKQHVSGNLKCSVSNNVSCVNTSKIIPTCGFIFINCTSNGTRISKWVYAANNTLCIEPTTAPTTDTTVALLPAMGGVLAALMILLMVGGVLVYTLRKKKSNNEKEEDDEQELTYQDVRFAQRPRLQPRVQRPGDEVEYGEIKFAERPRRTVGPTDDECVYAKVR